MSASSAVRNADDSGFCSVLGTFQADRGCRKPISVDHGPEDKVESTACLLVVEDEFLKHRCDITLAQVEKRQT